GDYVFVSGSKDEGKALLTVLISDGLVEKGYNAGKLVKAAGQFIQGGGGGQPSLATAGGKRPEGLPEAVDFVLGELGVKKKE
uniref:DHHA1 domain-containing protein n=1 Tax=uncultured Porphyromonas sp. TaxID=159274 RepID=UPI0026346033